MKPLHKVIRIDESEIRGRLDKMVRGTAEETLNAMLDAEADKLCQAQRHERSADRIDTRAGHYTRVSSGTVFKLNQKVYKHIERWRN